MNETNIFQANSSQTHPSADGKKPSFVPALVLGILSIVLGLLIALGFAALWAWWCLWPTILLAFGCSRKCEQNGINHKIWVDTEAVDDIIYLRRREQYGIDNEHECI